MDVGPRTSLSQLAEFISTNPGTRTKVNADHQQGVAVFINEQHQRQPLVACSTYVNRANWPNQNLLRLSGEFTELVDEID